MNKIRLKANSYTVNGRNSNKSIEIAPKNYRTFLANVSMSGAVAANGSNPAIPAHVQLNYILENTIGEFNLVMDSPNTFYIKFPNEPEIEGSANTLVRCNSIKTPSTVAGIEMIEYYGNTAWFNAIDYTGVLHETVYESFIEIRYYNNNVGIYQKYELQQ